MARSNSNILTLPTRNHSAPILPHPDHPVVLCGSLDVVSVLDLIQWLCGNRRSWTVRLFGQQAEGKVVVVAGQLWDARWGALQGERALEQIVRCQGGQFDLIPVAEDAEQTLGGNWRSLLLSTVQVLDEQRSGALPDSTRTPQPAVHLVELEDLPTRQGFSPVVEQLIDRGFSALRAGDRDEARRCWGEALALAPDHRTLRFNLRKLDLALESVGR